MFCGTAGARGDRGQDGVEICPGGKRADDAGGECAAGNDGGGVDCLWNITECFFVLWRLLECLTDYLPSVHLDNPPENQTGQFCLPFLYGGSSDINRPGRLSGKRLR